MSYFDGCYLKRMNANGKNRQERIKTRKEHEFDRLFLKETEYRAQIYEVNKQNCDIICSLQPNKWNENSILSNVLVSTSVDTFKTGDILRIKMQIKDAIDDRIWLILFVENNITNGYQTFKVICLDEEISINDEYGMSLYTIPVKFVSAKDTFIQDTFSFEGIGYREPRNDRSFITHDFSFLTKGTYYDYKERGWEIYGKDNISIKNVSYVSVSEKLQREEEPISSKELPVGEKDNFFLIGR